MSDSAFKSVPFSAYTTAELEAWVAAGPDYLHPCGTIESAILERMSVEIARRERVMDGDTSVMTNGERLHDAIDRARAMRAETQEMKLA